jgi:hypothetical protein
MQELNFEGYDRRREAKAEADAEAESERQPF